MPAIGILILFADQKFYLEKKVIDEIKQSALALSSKRRVPVLKISQHAGMITAWPQCPSPAARMRTRAMYKNIEDK